MSGQTLPPPPPSASPRFADKAASYDAHAGVQSDAAEWLAEWLPEPSKVRHCIELGAGTGLFTQHLKQGFERVISSDLSPEMIQICRSRARDFEYRIQDAWRPFPEDEAWQLICAAALLHWSPNPVQSLRQWAQALTQDGRILLSLFAKPSLPELLEVTGNEGPVSWKSPEEWEQYFEQAGLRLQRMEYITHRYTFASAMAFWKTLHGTGATVSRRLKPSAMFKLFRDYESRFSSGDQVYATWTFCRAELSL
ncbi:class I SAM-dependent methyltransferase [Coraliomargarita akajimensis]|uniref:Methyltransferase type 11 n=1 Tax=Coraliomargarita akajimensis (strain DSM 45221 / IAM 15411 / JCM 23193 / KCTC 12865 / 04OKA010-24) TaxID=583355 RepID=D5EHU7_CORAD|nr:class I SAM-dependent methyltransferase [Coraliomargarita akajimensis]ADE54138.1 Methyltransferase type 11 [Coraliomargarita akajimensis DSM 45221]